MINNWCVIFVLPFFAWASNSTVCQYNIIFSAFGHQNKAIAFRCRGDGQINCLVVPKDFDGDCKVPQMNDAVQLPFMQRIVLDYISSEIRARLQVIKTSHNVAVISKLGAEVRTLETDVLNWLCRQRCGQKPSCRFLTLLRSHAQPGFVSMEFRDHRRIISVVFPYDLMVRYIFNGAKNPKNWLEINCRKIWKTFYLFV